jgi:hypothetical protein
LFWTENGRFVFPLANYAGYAIYAGYEDCSTPDSFRYACIMDAFEQVVSEILWMSGFWVRTSVKVELTKEESA